MAINPVQPIYQSQFSNQQYNENNSNRRKRVDDDDNVVFQRMLQDEINEHKPLYSPYHFVDVFADIDDEIDSD